MPSSQACFIHFFARPYTEKRRTRKFVAGPGLMDCSSHRPSPQAHGRPSFQTGFPPGRTIACFGLAFQPRNQPSCRHSRPGRSAQVNTNPTTASKPTPNFVDGQAWIQLLCPHHRPITFFLLILTRNTHDGRSMIRNPRPWTKHELALLGTKPDAEVAELTGRTFGTVWQKRRALGIAQPTLRFRKWTTAEDKLVGTAPDAEIALRLGRTESAIKSRRAIL